MVLLRRWWPVPVLLASVLLIQKVFFESRYDVSGHAAEHLMSANAPFAGLALVLTLLFVTPHARRQAVVLIASAGWFAATVLVLVGNVRVVDALIRAGLGRTPTEASWRTPRSSRPMASQTLHRGAPSSLLWP